jgi:seryl-tRNA(Sec) selenium transferase
MKVGRETMAGVYAAVKHFMNGGAEATQEMARYIARELSGIRGISLRVDEPASHVHVDFGQGRSAIDRDVVKQRLAQGSPRVLVRDSGRHGIRVSAGTLAEGQELIVAARLKAVLEEIIVGSVGGAKTSSI